MCIFKTVFLSISVLFLSIVACSQQNSVEKIGTIETRQFNFPSDKYVMVAAHRAGGFKHGDAPENSLSAIKHALELGVDIIEIDVRITLDYKLVVMHDKTLDRTSNGTGKVSYHTLNEIKQFYLKDKNGSITKERIPTLEEVMITVGNKALVFIDKSELLLDYVIPILNKTNSVSQSLFMDFINLGDAKKRYGNLLSKSYFVPGVHNSISNLDKYFSEFEEGFMPKPAAFAFWFKEEDSKSFSLIKNAANSHIPVWINTTTIDQCAGHTDEESLVNPDNGWGWALKNGANIIFTDEPEALIKYLNSKGLR